MHTWRKTAGKQPACCTSVSDGGSGRSARPPAYARLSPAAVRALSDSTWARPRSDTAARRSSVSSTLLRGERWVGGAGASQRRVHRRAARRSAGRGALRRCRRRTAVRQLITGSPNDSADVDRGGPPGLQEWSECDTVA